MWGKLKTNIGRSKVTNPDNVEILAIFKQRRHTKYAIRAAWQLARHPREFLKDPTQEKVYYNPQLERMEGGFYWVDEGEIEVYDVSNNKAAKSLLSEEY